MALATKKIFKKSLLIPLLSLVLLGTGFFYYFHSAQAFTTNNGALAFADGTSGSTTNRGRISGQAYTFGTPGTFSTRFRLPSVDTTHAVQFVQNKAAPTRNEKMFGYEISRASTSELYVTTCTSSCTAQASLTAQWNTTLVGAAMTTSTVTRSYDIAYEQTSGRAMVVYAGNATGKLYYCIYDGTSWGPVSNCAPTNGTNDIALTDGTTTLATPTWVKLASNGSQYTDKRTNDILLSVQDNSTNRNIFVIRWNGSSWQTGDRQILTSTNGGTVSTTDGGTVPGADFDVGYESTSGLEVAVYAAGTTLSYRTSSGSGWSAATNIQTGLSSAPQWLSMASDPTSDRLSLIMLFGSTVTARPFIWKANGSVGWTAGTDLSVVSANTSNSITTAWLKANGGTPKALFAASANANTTIPDWTSWTQGAGTGTFASWAAFSGAGTGTPDTNIGNELVSSPNSDIVTLIQEDRDGKLRARTYDGTAWGTIIVTNFTTTATTAIAGEVTNRTIQTQRPFQYSYNPYSAWSTNWRVYDDEAASGNPQQTLAAQNGVATVKPNNIVRLRMAIAELGGGSSSGSRKKLQYSSGAGCPDSTTCTWTDVGAQASGSIWRYGNGGATDDALISSTTLTGATAQGRVVENGTATSADAPTGSSVSEYDFTVQNNGATIGTNYYFRAYDFAASHTGATTSNINAIYREQILNSAGTEQTNCSDGTTAMVCTYPTLYAYTSAPHPPTFYRPTNGNTNVSTTPIIQLKSSDDENDYIDYVVEYCGANSWPCASGGGVFCQLDVIIAPVCTGSQVGWNGQDANSGLAYIGNFSEANSTVAAYTVNPGIFRPNTTYYLRAKAIDPGGSGTYSLYSSTVGFTTSTLEIRINGGTCIGGVGSSCTAGSGSFPIKIGN